MESFGTTKFGVVVVKAGAAKTKNGLFTFWRGFDPLGFKVLSSFLYYALNSSI